MDMDGLYQSLRERWMPEQAAQAILAVADPRRLPDEVRTQLERAQPRYRYSSMSTRFRKATPVTKQLKTASELFPAVPVPTDPTNSAQLAAYTDQLFAALQVAYDADFLHGRANRTARKEKQLPPGHRAYNKRFRFIRRFMVKTGQFSKSAEMADLAQVAKTLLASRIPRDEFRRDRRSAYFITYLTARLGMRSEFTASSQKRAYDTIADALFKMLTRRANWYAIAHVYPDQAVVAHLTEREKGQLFGQWFEVMNRASLVLGNLASQGVYDLDELVVRRGNDSSTWNEAAGAFNKARDGWVTTCYALGMESFLDKFLPGKALRLMAADVVAMHRHWGSGGLEPDTKVWADLPKPWEVLDGERPCNRTVIEEVCRRHGVTGKGWVAPRQRSQVEVFTPTPELVHGVTVTSPMLAATLRRLGVFSGKTKGVAVEVGAVV